MRPSKADRLGWKTTYTYDNQGNQTQSVLTLSGQSRTVNCTYDGFNRLKKVSDNSGETVYTYDADGLRTSKAGPAGTEYYVYDNGQLVVTIGAAAASSVSYIRGLNLIASVKDGVPTYYHYDAHGDVVQTTNASGAVIHAYDYDAFGVERNASDTDTNPFRYCGEQYDAETGNYYLRARYYAPGVGRFTQADTHWNPGNMVYGDEPPKWNEYQSWLDEDDRDDPLGLHTYTYKPEPTAIAQAGNLYGYALNNPVLYRDSAGESVILACIVIGAVVGASVNAGMNVYGQIKSGKSFKDINWKSVGVSLVAGGISGGIAGSPIGLLGQVAFNALISGTESALQDKVYGRNVDWVKVGVSAGIGGLAGVVGGNGATKPTKTVYGRFVSNGSTISTVWLTYESRTKAEAAAKALVKGMSASYGTQIIVTDKVLKIVYK